MIEWKNMNEQYNDCDGEGLNMHCWIRDDEDDDERIKK